MSPLASLCLTPHLCPTLWMLLLSGSKVLNTPLSSTFPQMNNFNQKLGLNEIRLILFSMLIIVKKNITQRQRINKRWGNGSIGKVLTVKA